MVTTPDPPRPFDPEDVELRAGHGVLRVHHKDRRGDEFNPGYGSPTRFAFFGDPSVPALYAADTTDAAIAETLLHDVPLVGGQITPSVYEDRRMSMLRTTRVLRMASLMGLGLRRLGVTADQVTTTAASQYDRTVDWAHAAHEAGFDGIAYMSRQCNSDRAYVFFGDRTGDAFDVDPTFRWNFADPVRGRPDLITLCNALGVEVFVR